MGTPEIILIIAAVIMVFLAIRLVTSLFDAKKIK